MAVLEDRVVWIGKGNREDLTIPVRELREWALQLRKSRGRLVLSPVGRGMREGPVAPWRFVTDAMPGDEEQILGTEARCCSSASQRGNHRLGATGQRVRPDPPLVGQPGARTVQVLLDEIAHDPTAIFGDDTPAASPRC